MINVTPTPSPYLADSSGTGRNYCLKGENALQAVVQPEEATA